MKTKILFFSLVSISLTVLSARASSPAAESSPIRLPAFIVETPRQTPAEKAIAQSLDALRALATKPISIKVDVPMAKTKTIPAGADQKAPAKTVVVAGI